VVAPVAPRIPPAAQREPGPEPGVVGTCFAARLVKLHHRATTAECPYENPLALAYLLIAVTPILPLPDWPIAICS
jgi:hypothetical protein